MEEMDNGFITYMWKYNNKFEAGTASTNDMIINLGSAIILQYIIMEFSGVQFRRDSAKLLENTHVSSAICDITKQLCIIHYTGINNTWPLCYNDPLLFYCFYSD